MLLKIKCFHCQTYMSYIFYFKTVELGRGATCRNSNWNFKSLRLKARCRSHWWRLVYCFYIQSKACFNFEISPQSRRCKGHKDWATSAVAMTTWTLTTIWTRMSVSRPSSRTRFRSPHRSRLVRTNRQKSSVQLDQLRLATCSIQIAWWRSSRASFRSSKGTAPRLATSKTATTRPKTGWRWKALGRMLSEVCPEQCFRIWNYFNITL